MNNQLDKLKVLLSYNNYHMNMNENRTEYNHPKIEINGTQYYSNKMYMNKLLKASGLPNVDTINKIRSNEGEIGITNLIYPGIIATNDSLMSFIYISTTASCINLINICSNITENYTNVVVMGDTTDWTKFQIVVTTKGGCEYLIDIDMSSEYIVMYRVRYKESMYPEVLINSHLYELNIDATIKEMLEMKIDEDNLMKSESYMENPNDLVCDDVAKLLKSAGIIKWTTRGGVTKYKFTSDITEYARSELIIEMLSFINSFSRRKYYTVSIASIYVINNFISAIWDFMLEYLKHGDEPSIKLNMPSYLWALTHWDPNLD